MIKGTILNSETGATEFSSLSLIEINHVIGFDATPCQEEKPRGLLQYCILSSSTVPTERFRSRYEHIRDVPEQVTDENGASGSKSFS